MEEQYKIPPLPSSGAPPANPPAPPDEAEPEPSALPDPLSTQDADALLSTLGTDDRYNDNVSPLDVQYLDLTHKFQSVLRKTQVWKAPSHPSKESDVISSLQEALVDLRVWAYDLSDNDDAFFECLRQLSSQAHELNTRLLQVFGSIRIFLTSIGEAIDNHGEATLG
jgi:hypothetical protein